MVRHIARQRIGIWGLIVERGDERESRERRLVGEQREEMRERR
jgi:hypothetical protein